MMSTPTVLVLPAPGQGHVNPMMILSHKLVDHGCNIIFVNSDFNHKRVVRSMDNNNGSSSPIKLVSISDGLGPEHDRVDLGELCDSMLRTMPSELEKLIEDLQLNEGIKVTCVVADVFMGWALEVARKVGIKGAFFWPAAASVFVLQYNASNLVADAILDSDAISISSLLSPKILTEKGRNLLVFSVADSTANDPEQARHVYKFLM
ncbi:UDP-glycosyltransferase 83A1-like isoform X1 [Arachis hypogaea]|uniref:UDP-glycosyltransferase 83A1-like isoform X1 n=1 Tax=Arachis hypogaea TaxID=3818 RepID=UPI003B2111AD